MIQTPLNYTGSKFRLLDQILPNLDYTKTHFIDLFCGGGSVYTNVLDKYEKVLVNDIISDLIGIHKGILESDDIIESTKYLNPGKDNKQVFLDLRNSYNLDPSPDKLWALMLSSTNNMMRFNKSFKYNQTYGERGWNNNTDIKVEEYKNHIRKFKDKISFSSKNFKDISIKSDKIMIYCDPPYSNTEAGYNAYWEKDDDIKLYNYLKESDSIGASFMISGVLTHDEVPCLLLEKLIKDGFNYKELEFDYNKVSRKGKKETKEIIIMNYDV
jgi:DNA adenine methylase Dam